jgi:hypothetical protein
MPCTHCVHVSMHCAAGTACVDGDGIPVVHRTAAVASHVLKEQAVGRDSEDGEAHSSGEATWDEER